MKRHLVLFACLVTVSYVDMVGAGQRETLDFAFGENNSWAVTYRVNGRVIAHFENLLPPVREYLKRASSEGKTLSGIGLDGKAGWVVCSETSRRHYSKGENLYSSVSNKVKQLNKEGWQVKDVALTSEGGYVVIYGRSNSHENGYRYHNIPSDLTDKLKSVQAEGGWLTGVGISPSGAWAVAYTHDGNCWHYRSSAGLPEGAVDFLESNF